jgi:hypothetical protein
MADMHSSVLQGNFSALLSTAEWLGCEQQALCIAGSSIKHILKLLLHKHN